MLINKEAPARANVGGSPPTDATDNVTHPSTRGAASAWTPEALRREALACVERGWAVFPVNRDKTPGRAPGALVPMTLSTGERVKLRRDWGVKGVHDARADRALVERAWNGARAFNIGLACGVVSGVVVVDVDAYKGAEVAAWLAAARADGRLPPTLEHRTGSGGAHLVYALPPGLERARPLRPVPGVEVQGDGSYVVWAGENAKGPYLAVNDLPIAPAPAWLVEQWQADATRRARGKVAARARLRGACAEPGEPLLVRLYRAAGLPVGERREGGEGAPMWFVDCPFEDKHTTPNPGALDSDTALLGGTPAGAFKCQHGAHGGRGEVTTADALAWFREAHGAAYYAAIGGGTLPGEGAPPTVDADELEGRLADFFDEALNVDEPALNVLRITTGAGKTHAAVRLAARLAKRGERRVTVVTPTHRLGAEQEARARREGADAADVWRPVSLGHRSSACRVKPLARALSVIGRSPRATLCPTCPHRPECPETKDVVGVGDRPLRILQHAVAADVFAEAGDRDVVMVDELPEMTRAVGVDAQTLDALDALRAYVAPATFEAVRLVRDSLRGVVGQAVEGMSLRTLLSAGVDPTVVANSAPKRVTKVLKALATPVEVERVKVAQSAAGALRAGRDDDRTLGKVARALELLRALRAAASRPDAPLVHVGCEGGLELVFAAPWVDAASDAVTRGARVVVMSATAPIELIKARASVPVRAVEVHAADAPGVRRVWVQNSSASRKHWCGGEGGAQAKNLRGALHDVAAQLERAGARSAVVVSFKRLVPALQAAFEVAAAGGESDAVPPNLAAWLRGRGRVDWLWYGATEGVDAYKDADAVVTLGDPRINVKASDRAGAVDGLEAGAHNDDATATHLEQAWGRIRPVHRGGRQALIVHVGAVAPDVSRAPQWAGAEVVGTAPALPDLETLRAAYAELGSVRKVAARFGLPKSTVGDALRGGGPGAASGAVPERFPVSELPEKRERGSPPEFGHREPASFPGVPRAQPPADLAARARALPGSLAARAKALGVRKATLSRVLKEHPAPEPTPLAAEPPPGDAIARWHVELEKERLAMARGEVYVSPYREPTDSELGADAFPFGANAYLATDPPLLAPAA